MLHQFWDPSVDPTIATYKKKYWYFNGSVPHSNENIGTDPNLKIYVSQSAHFWYDSNNEIHYELVNPVEYTIETFNNFEFTGNIFWKYNNPEVTIDDVHFTDYSTSSSHRVCIDWNNTYYRLRLKHISASVYSNFLETIEWRSETYTASPSTPEVRDQTVTDMSDLMLIIRTSQLPSPMFDSTNIIGGVNYKQDINSEENINVGTVSTTSISFTVWGYWPSSNIGTVLNYYNKNVEDNNYTFVGRFTVTSIENVNSRTNIVMYDDMNLFDTDVSDWCKDISGGGEYKWNKWTFDTATVNIRAHNWGEPDMRNYVYYSSSLVYYPTSTALNYQLDAATDPPPYIDIWKIFTGEQSVNTLKNKYIYFNDTCLVEKNSSGSWVEVSNDYKVYLTGNDITVDTTNEIINFNSLTPVSIVDIEKLSSSNPSEYPTSTRSGDYYYYRYYIPSQALLPCTLYEFAGHVCNKFGFVLDNESLRNGDFIVTQLSMSSTNATGKDLLKFIGECSGNFVMIAQNEEHSSYTYHIKMITYSEPSNAITLTSGEYVTFDVAEYTCSVTGVWIEAEDADKSTEIGGGTNEVYIQGNPIFQKSSKTYLGDEARSIYYKLKSLGNYYPAKVTTLRDYRFEVGDIIYVNSNKKMLVMSKEINKNNVVLTCKGSIARTL